jgi:ABC-type transporter Mla MlaB component
MTAMAGPGTSIALRRRRKIMLRISETTTTPGQITLRLDGEIKGRWVEELRVECVRASGGAPDGRRLVLDLAEVSSIDAAGVALIRDLTSRGVSMMNPSPYVAELLKRAMDR